MPPSVGFVGWSSWSTLPGMQRFISKKEGTGMKIDDLGKAVKEGKKIRRAGEVRVLSSAADGTIVNQGGAVATFTSEDLIATDWEIVE